MKRIEVKRTIQNSDFHVALQRKLIFFKVTCCLSLRLLRKPHLKLFSTEKKEKGTITVICGAVWARSLGNLNDCNSITYNEINLNYSSWATD